MSGIFEFSELKIPAPENKLTPTLSRRLMGNIGAAMLGQRLTVFQDEGRGMNPPWAPLSRAYAKWKLKRYGGASSKILSLTNALRMSFTARNLGAKQPEGDGSLDVTDTEAKLTSHVPYAAIQNFGGTVLKENTPRDTHFKEFTKGRRAGERQFASKKEIEQGSGKTWKVLNSRSGGRGVGTYVTIPARPFDQFRDSDVEEINHLIEDAISG